MQREEALEVALLAKAVGSHLVGVDQLTVEKSNSSGPANKINMQNFIAPIVGQQIKTQQYESGATPEMIKAYHGLNELALQSIPDVNSPINPSPISNINIQQPVSNIHAGSPVNQISQTKMVKENLNVGLFTRSDIDGIRNSLKGIDKSLAGLLNYLKNSKK